MNLDRVRQFAAALDREDWALAQSFVDESCAYRLGSETLRGPEAILASYRASAAWGRHNLDSVRNESAVREDEEGIVIEYTDVIERGGAQHTYRCQQRVALGEGGLIVRIEHHELPGEKEALEAYWRAIGVRRHG